MTEQEFLAKQTEILAFVPDFYHEWLSYKAWDDGHAFGYKEVLLHLEDFVCGLTKCLEKRNTSVGRRKITVGFVIQTYDDSGDCIAQEFIAEDQVDWEDEKGGFIPTPVHNYQSFDMVQP